MTAFSLNFQGKCSTGHYRKMINKVGWKRVASEDEYAIVVSEFNER